MQQDANLAAAYVVALTGRPAETGAIWWRAIHDTDKKAQAIKRYGTLAQCWNELCQLNNNGYGIFANINAFAPNATTHNLADVWYIRTHVVDLDNTLTAPANYQRAAQGEPRPSFAVNTSPGKFHIYWPCPPYAGNERYETVSRKLRQIFDGDKSVIDPTRVLRVPGFFHRKGEPHLVTCHALPGYGTSHSIETMEAALAHVNVIHGGGGRSELGTPELAAPSLDWLRLGLSLIDPNNLDRGEWISLTAAFKQSGWGLADEATLFNLWSEWCTRYEHNDIGENNKQWNSIRDTEVGWAHFKRKAPVLVAYEKFGTKPETVQTPQPVQQPQTLSTPPIDHTLPDILSDMECKQYFRNCFFVERMGQMLTPGGRFMNSTQFNGRYGGKLFVITPDGKTTDEPWKAATRSTLWTVPKVDHVRFVPDQPPFAIIEDQMGRLGVNTYIPIRIIAAPGDITPFIRHMELMLPNEMDRRQIYEYFAHNVKYPGYKIPWAPMIQSTEGVGKSFIQEAMEGVLGEMYTYSPKAQELVKSGSTFNAWMRGKLMIIVNEIKVDERRELIEILKPMITDKRVEIQSKGVDQEQEDNLANWLFFSNYKDAIPVTQNGRRYALYYSAIQSKSDLLSSGMDDAYFNNLFNWLRNGGIPIIAHWLLNYPLERGAISMRAPDTSSMAEAIRVSRGPIETQIMHAVEDGAAGFRGGYIGLTAVMNRLRASGGRQPALRTVQGILEQMGYTELGRAPRQFGQESMTERTTVYGAAPNLSPAGYGRAQGYE